MAHRSTRIRMIAALAVLALLTVGLGALAWASDVDDDGPEIESVTGTTTSVVVQFDEAIDASRVSPGDFAFEHFGQNSEAPHIHRPTSVSVSSDGATVTLNGLRPLHPDVSLPLVVAYVQDLSGNVSRPEESFTPSG
jgi:hypothetical protein